MVLSSGNFFKKYIPYSCSYIYVFTKVEIRGDCLTILDQRKKTVYRFEIGLVPWYVFIVYLFVSAGQLDSHVCLYELHLCKLLYLWVPVNNV